MSSTDDATYLKAAMDTLQKAVNIAAGEDGDPDFYQTVRNLMLVQSLALISIAQSLEKIELAIYRTNQ